MNLSCHSWIQHTFTVCIACRLCQRGGRGVPSCGDSKMGVPQLPSVQWICSRSRTATRLQSQWAKCMYQFSCLRTHDSVLYVTRRATVQTSTRPTHRPLCWTPLYGRAWHQLLFPASPSIVSVLSLASC